MRTGRATSIVGSAAVIGLVFAGLTPNSAGGYPQYDLGCNNCHGDFNQPGGSYISLKDGTDWGIDLMTGHLNIGETTCTTCHISTGEFFPVYTNQSGDPVFDQGCLGCHGRTDDESGLCTFDQPDDGTQHCGSGAGLRQHHINSGVEVCAFCHTNDTDPLLFTPVGESNPTIPNGLEGCSDVFFGPTGLDNDGDLLDDGADPDCADCPTDLTGDGQTDAGDLAILLGAWGPNPGNPADLTGDGIVDAQDLALLLGNWGPCA